MHYIVHLIAELVFLGMVGLMVLLVFLAMTEGWRR